MDWLTLWLPRAGADAIIRQGLEAGGHVRGKVTSLVLLPQITATARVPVLGSGGFGSGGSLVAALALGAEGVHCGTAFLATDESYAHEYHKQRVVDASSEDTVYSDVFAIGWPPQSPVRTIGNSITKLHADSLLGHGPDDFAREVIAHDGEDEVYPFSTLFAVATYDRRYGSIGIVCRPTVGRDQSNTPGGPSRPRYGGRGTLDTRSHAFHGLGGLFAALFARTKRTTAFAKPRKDLVCWALLIRLRFAFIFFACFRDSLCSYGSQFLTHSQKFFVRGNVGNDQWSRHYIRLLG